VTSDVDLSLHRSQDSGGTRQPPRAAGVLVERRRQMLWLIPLLALVCGTGGGYYGYTRWGAGGGLGISATVLLVVVIGFLFGG
jgi:hypothetical protein